MQKYEYERYFLYVQANVTLITAEYVLGNLSWNDAVLRDIMHATEL